MQKTILYTVHKKKERRAAMLKKDREIFGSDDWLEKEIERESRISAWDIDGGRIFRAGSGVGTSARRLAAEHALDCDAKEEAIKHRAEHIAEDAAPGYRKFNTAGDRSETEMKPDGKKIQGVIAGLVVIAIVFPPLLVLLPPIIVGLILMNAKKEK